MEVRNVGGERREQLRTRIFCGTLDPHRQSSDEQWRIAVIVGIFASKECASEFHARWSHTQDDDNEIHATRGPIIRAVRAEVLARKYGLQYWCDWAVVMNAPQQYYRLEHRNNRLVAVEISPQ